MQTLTKTCVVSCPISTRSGYGARSRDFVRALIEAKPDWDISTKMGSMSNGCIG